MSVLCECQLLLPWYGSFPSLRSFTYSHALLSTVSNTQEDLLQSSGFLFCAVLFFLELCLVNSSCLALLGLLPHLLTTQILCLGSSFPKWWPGNSFRVKSWGTYKAHLIAFVRGHCPFCHLSNVLRHCFICFIVF